MSGTPDLSLAEQIDAICDRFEQDFRTGNNPQIESCLGDLQEPLRSSLLKAVLGVEIELRRQQGEKPEEREYLARFLEQTEAVRQAFAEMRSVLSSVTMSAVETSQRPAASKAKPVSGGERRRSLGRFKILALLGEGAFGTVYRARDPQLDREVAIKVPRFGTLQSDGERERFSREARAAANLHHANICPVHEVGEVDGCDYIVMAFIDGKPLSKALQAQTKPSEKQIASVVRRLALALQEAHDKGIIHRDLKPANIMINRKGEPVIMDFGLARRENSGDAQISQSGQIMGTPAYMSPEQARGDGKTVGPTADIYSLGVVFYELLCGRRPFEGTITEVIGKILHVEAEPPSKHLAGVDSRLEEICLKAIAKQPADRFASMKEFADALTEYLKTGSTVQPKASATIEGRAPEQSLRTQNFAELMAAVSSDLEKKVELAVGRSAKPQKVKIPWWTYLVGSGLMGAVVLLGVLFFVRSDGVKVTIELTDVDLSDKTLSFFLDEEPISAESLASPIELKPGEHVLVVKRGQEVVKRVLLTVAGGRSPGLKYKDITPTPQQEPPPRIADDADRELATWFLRNGLYVGVTTGDRPTTYEQIDGHWRWFTRPEELPKESFQLTGIGQTYKQISPEAIKRIGEVKNLVYLSLFGCAPVDDASLAAISNCRQLVWLNAEVTKVTDAGLKHLSGLKHLQRLELGHTTVTGSGLADMPNVPLTWLALGWGGNQESNQAICRFKQLKHLWAQSDKNGDSEALKLIQSLPKLSGLHLRYARLTDDGLAALAELNDLEALELPNTRITGEGLKHLARLPNLRRVWVHDTPLTDEGLRRLRQVPQLTLLWAGNTRITDTGLAHLKGMETLLELRVPDTAISDAGLKHLGGLRGLRLLALDGTRVTDDGLKHLGDCLSLAGVWLTNTAVTDAGLEHLKTMRQLSTLGLSKTGVTDAGLKHLTVIRSLQELDLRDTAVTADGLWRLKAALPGCKITPEPPAGNTDQERIADRRVAELVLGLGGEVQIEVADKRMGIKSARELPPADFALVSVSLANNDRVKDDELVALTEAKRLEGLNLNGTAITSRGLARLRSLTGLKYLNLCVPALRDADLAVIKPLPRLYSLEISYTPIGDAGLKHLAECASLRTLYLTDTKVTDSGVAMLKAALPRCEVVGKAPSQDPNRAAAEWALRRGAVVVIKGSEEKRVTATDQLPTARFQLIGVAFPSEFDVSAAGGLQPLKELTHLRDLSLFNAKLNDDDLQPIEGMTSLHSLSLHGATVTDAVMASIATLPNLEELWLHYRPITDEGLAKIAGLKKLKKLLLRRTNIGPDGLKVIGGFTDLEHLDVGGARAIDDSLAHLTPLRKLKHLEIEGTPLTGSGLKYLAGLPTLEKLSIGDGTYAGNGSITDDGIRALAGLNGLHELAINDSAAGRLTDATLEVVGRLNGLEALSLAIPGATDAGMTHLKNLTSLSSLRLHGAKITDEGLKHLGPLWRLRTLEFSGTAASGAGLVHLTKLGQLSSLSFQDSPITDAGLAGIVGLKALKELNLARTKVTDEGLATLAKHAGLKHVDLTGCPISNDGLRRLKAALPGCKIIPEPVTVKVQVPLPAGIDLNDASLAFFLDQRPVTADELGKPIELEPGDHELLVKRGELEIQRVRFLVTVEKDVVAVKVKDGTSALAVPPAGASAEPWTWSDPVHIGRGIDAEASGESTVAVSPDELSLLFVRSMPGENQAIWRASRPSKFAAFETPEKVEQLETGNGAGTSAFMGDGLTIFFDAYNDKHWDIWTARRPKLNQPFGPPERVRGPVNTAGVEAKPSITADGLTLFFHSDRKVPDNPQAVWSIWMSRRTALDQEFGAPVPLGPNVNAAGRNWDPAISADGLALIFASDRTGGFGNNDLWMSTRASRDAAFGPAVNLGSRINTSAQEGKPSLSPDGQTLYFTSKRGGEGELWVSHRDNDLNRMQGAWDVGAEEFNGVETKPAEIQASRKTLQVNGNQFVISRVFKDGSTGAFTGRIQLNPQSNPKQFDWTGTEPGGKPTEMLGLYELDGDTLKIVYSFQQGPPAKPRPTAFTTRGPGSGVVVSTFRRRPKEDTQAGEWISLFNGKDLSGWTPVASDGAWSAQQGAIAGTAGSGTKGQGWLATDRDFGDFELEFEYRIPSGGNTGVFLRAPATGDPTGEGLLEVQLIDETAPAYSNVPERNRTGAVVGLFKAKPKAVAPPNAWNKVSILAVGPRITVAVNGRKISEGNLDDEPQATLPTSLRPAGRIGLQRHKSNNEFRNLRIREHGNH